MSLPGSRPLFASLFSCILFPAFAMAQQSGSEPPGLFVQLLMTWTPLLVLVGLWWWLFTRIGLSRNRKYMERALEHMNKLEAQNAEIIEVLKQVESKLGGR